MKREITILVLLIIGMTGFGQQNLGLKINAGLSKISNNLNSPQSKIVIQFVPSGYVGLFYDLQLGDRSRLGAELLFIQIEGKERHETDLTDQSGNPTGELLTSEVWKHISYIGMPIWYGFKVNKLTINIGLQVSTVLTSRGREKGRVLYNGDVIVWDKSGEINIDSYDFGPRAGLIFSLTDKFAIEGTYYYGINNILGNSLATDWTWRIHQTTIGIKYNFL